MKIELSSSAPPKTIAKQEAPYSGVFTAALASLSAAQMFIEELQNSADSLNLILFLDEPVSFRKDHVFHHDSVLLHCSHNVI